MFLTLDILEKYNACESGKQLFQRLYPNGVEIIQLLKNRHIPKEVLYWGEEFLPVSEEELILFKEVCGIEYSTDVYHSYNIKNSHIIANSHDILDSKDIKGGKFITDGYKCVDSHDIKSCRYLYSSSESENSSYCIGSSNLIGCSDIVNSSNLTNCLYVSNSNFLGRCSVIYNSMISEDCYFSSYLKNCKRCLFSTEQEGQELLLFNKPTNELVFNQVVRAFNVKLRHEIFSFWDEKEGLLIAKNDFSSFFNKVSSEFWKWVKTLPNYDAFVLYQITFKRELLD